MISNHKIRGYSSIKNNKIVFNGDLVFEEKTEDFSTFIKAAYRALELNYPKFFKMDNLSKLALIASDILLKSFGENEEKIAVILSNKASSLDTDRKHQSSISTSENYYPSPSVFVYTLPNICIGEICIKHRLFSENSFFIFDAFNPEHLWIQAEHLLKSKKAAEVLCGWVDFDTDNYNAFMYLVERNGSYNHTIEDLKKLFLCQ